MRFVTEYRDAALCQRLAEELASTATRPWTIMEICGGQTHAIMKFGLDRLLPEAITLVHGPGCPVCVTPLEMIEKALQLAARPEVTFCSFGDMLRVPGVSRDLLTVKAEGGDVRIVYSPLDAVRLASEHQERQVVFFAVGFETTAPANALAVYQAAQQGIPNFSVLVAQVLVPPAIAALLSAPDCRVQGFLAAGHVCTVMGYEEYEPLAERYQVPIVVTGFEPVDLLEGILACVRQLEAGTATVENRYARAVRREGNPGAREVVRRVFRVVPRSWRGLGVIPDSGLALREAYAGFDAELRFGLADLSVAEPADCLSGLVLQGRTRPDECPAFGTRCTPEHPLGATMVSSEGACAAYYRYRGQVRHQEGPASAGPQAPPTAGPAEAGPSGRRTAGRAGPASPDG
jgi:hydrogenase expression/formation protein HypD